MSVSEKRAREEKRDRKARAKAQRRLDKRNAPPSGPQIISAAEIIGNVRSIEETLASLQGGARIQRSAAPIPSKLFVGSLSDGTNSAGLRAHFAPYGAIAEAVVILDRNSGASRNFGFVTMLDRKDAAGVIAALHHSELDGNRIVVNVATESR